MISLRFDISCPFSYFLPSRKHASFSLSRYRGILFFSSFAIIDRQIPYFSISSSSLHYSRYRYTRYAFFFIFLHIWKENEATSLLLFHISHITVDIWYYLSHSLSFHIFHFMTHSFFCLYSSFSSMILQLSSHIQIYSLHYINRHFFNRYFSWIAR